MAKWNLSEVCRAGSTFTNSLMQPVAQQTEKSMVILIDAEKKIDKIQYHFIIKTLSKLGTEENFLTLINNMY